ncbi:MAG: DUF4364 family protein [Oscillospiraceae bacterium]|nr:DUF4364 family protein [Oscillospiraceae bacterium]
MSQTAFSAGVKPGGLTSETEIKILLCYLLASVGRPLSQGQLEEALAGKELVNCFELAHALQALCRQGHIQQQDELYHITPSGVNLSEMLATDVPVSVRETALSAVLHLERLSRQSLHNQSEIKAEEHGYLVRCRIVDKAGPPVFQLEVYLPDLASAQLAQKKFIENGDAVYLLTLAGLTGQKDLAAAYLQGPGPQE